MPEQAKRSFSAPKGTRDMYPAELLRRRYIEKLWRDTAIRHGFEEIDGPAFEYTELYTAKSGEGIVSEIFGVFSGKDEAEVAALRAGGQAPFALRPEFTPTLARMYAARAAQLPKPTKWFWQQNCYRAERPQRGRLREFGQWNVDFIGGTTEPDVLAALDTDVLECCINCFRILGISHEDLRIEYAHRCLIDSLLLSVGIPERQLDSWRGWIDGYDKHSLAERTAIASSFGATADEVRIVELLWSGADPKEFARTREEAIRSGKEGIVADATAKAHALSASLTSRLEELEHFESFIEYVSLDVWCKRNSRIVRGLAYYTGMVFEVHETGGKERAVAGGGRYDNLIETFGGPPTPAVGFGMGDVVLGNILQDRGLMPEGRDLLAALSAPSASFRPDVFVIANEKDESQAALRPLVARLRRGVESEAWLAKEGRKPWDTDRYAAKPLHARHSYKATKNIGKLLQEAAAQHARFAAIIESAGEATLKNLDTREEFKGVPLDGIAARIV